VLVVEALWSLLVVLAAPVVVLLEGGVCAVVEAAFWSVEVPVVAAPLVVLAGGFCAEVALWSVVLVLVEADVEPLPTVLDGVWLLTGGVV
jgi:hypothetical protein